jgi:hypothetical protein
MLGKVLVTLLPLVLVRFAARGRGCGIATEPRNPLAPAGVLKFVAYGLASLSVVGSAIYLRAGREHGQEVVRVRITNAQTGNAVTRHARRGELAGRSFRTLDGRTITLAEADRMEMRGEGQVPRAATGEGAVEQRLWSPPLRPAGTATVSTMQPERSP